MQKRSFNGRQNTLVGRMFPPKPNHAIYKTYFTHPLTYHDDIRVLAMDTQSHALLYQCREVLWSGFILEKAWMWSRNKTLDAEKIFELRKVLTTINSNSNDLLYVNQENCPEI